jgi:hypothetical protein
MLYRPELFLFVFALLAISRSSLVKHKPPNTGPEFGKFVFYLRLGYKVNILKRMQMNLKKIFSQ